jgi:hypothetical protein
MRTLRNLSFVALIVTAFATNTVDVAAAPEPVGCPEAYADGCGCSGECLGMEPFALNAYYEVSCTEVYDCETTYPDFCDDFMDACYDFCWDSSESLPWDTSCGSNFGECNGTCLCDTASFCDVGEYNPEG